MLFRSNDVPNSIVCVLELGRTGQTALVSKSVWVSACGVCGPTLIRERVPALKGLCVAGAISLTVSGIPDQLASVRAFIPRPKTGPIAA